MDDVLLIFLNVLKTDVIMLEKGNVPNKIYLFYNIDGITNLH
jgi:hypothetical protein